MRFISITHSGLHKNIKTSIDDWNELLPLNSNPFILPVPTHLPKVFFKFINLHNEWVLEDGLDVEDCNGFINHVANVIDSSESDYSKELPQDHVALPRNSELPQETVEPIEIQSSIQEKKAPMELPLDVLPVEVDSINLEIPESSTVTEAIDTALEKRSGEEPNANRINTTENIKEKPKESITFNNVTYENILGLVKTNDDTIVNDQASTDSNMIPVLLPEKEEKILPTHQSSRTGASFESVKPEKKKWWKKFNLFKRKSA